MIWIHSWLGYLPLLIVWSTDPHTEEVPACFASLVSEFLVANNRTHSDWFKQKWDLLKDIW